MNEEPLRRRLRARALRGFAGLAKALPEGAVRAPLALVARGARFAPGEAGILANLELALGSETDERERREIAAGVRQHAARLLYEWARLEAGRDARPWLERIVDVDDSIERLDRLYEQGRGVILVTAHVGNWEALAIALRARGYRGTVVGRRRERDSASEFLVDLRRAWDLPSLAQDCPAREPLRVLHDGAILGLLADLEVLRLDGEFLPFFGVPALTMTAPAALARAAGLPLLPVRCVRPRGASSSVPYRLSFESPLELDLALPRRAARTDLTRRLNAIYERWIRETPEQWAWHQPRWRTKPGERTIQPWAGHRHGSGGRSRPRPAPIAARTSAEEPH